MRSISHIVNLGVFPESSDLHSAQPVTVETMKRARDYAAPFVKVTLLSAQYEEDRTAVPAGFVATPDLERSVLDVGHFKVRRKLPLMQDILDRARQATDSDYIIYTNIDIGLQPNFYLSVNSLIDQGYDAFVVNRRTISKAHTGVKDLPLMFAEVGRPHMGYDCFIFRRDACEKFNLGLACVGASYVGKVMLINQVVNSRKFEIFLDLHLTFHVGNDQVWRSPALEDYARHNRTEFEKIIAGLDADQRRIVRKTLSAGRRAGIKRGLAGLLGLSS